MKKTPPIEKVFEAWTAIADGRIELTENTATVSSSDSKRQYTVRFNGDTYSSDDNATYWQGYPGYPVIATLMLQGKLPLDRDQALLWRGVNWKAINTKFKNNYCAAVQSVAEARHIDLTQSYAAAGTVLNILSTLPLTIKRKLP